MEIISVPANAKTAYNRFVHQHYPPVGAFMQTWEWGAFQEALGRKVGRYFLERNGETVAAFTLVHHALPLGLSYIYAPRGPVISHAVKEQEYFDIFDSIGRWVREKFPELIFIRLEPPARSFMDGIETDKFSIPPYYIQPRFNLAIPLHMTEEEIMASFHSSTRSNIRRAEKREVQVKIVPSSEKLFDQFLAMTRDTIQRNSGKNAYPTPTYFKALFETIPILGKTDDHRKLSIGTFCGYKGDEPAAIHFVLFFGDTATYLYGATYSRYLNSKVTTRLHWEAIREAKRRGMKYYDIGGIDEVRWPTLTAFKRQFKGEEFSYVGNIDILIRPRMYGFYNLIRRFQKT